MSADLIVEELPDGRFKVRLAIPHSRIDGFYTGRVREQILRRRAEIVSIATAVFRHHRRFLVDGAIKLRLKMQQIAVETGLSVGSVSKAIDDKWVQTPQGLYPLKRFFAPAVSDPERKNEIQNKIQELIAGEDKRKPYSDDQLVAQLKQHGFSAARRTITKHRKKLGIPSSRQRRRW